MSALSDTFQLQPVSSDSISLSPSSSLLYKSLLTNLTIKEIIKWDIPST